MRVWLLSLFLLSLPAQAADNAIDFGHDKTRARAEQAMQEVQRLSSDIQQLKQRVISLNKDLQATEEALLFPTNSQFTVFVSQTGGAFLRWKACAWSSTTAPWPAICIPPVSVKRCSAAAYRNSL